MQNLIATIKKSGEFDEKWYAKSYPDVAHSGLEPIEHFLRYGAWLGREPSPVFDTNQYLLETPDIDSREIIPFVHHVLRAEERNNPNPLEDEDPNLHEDGTQIVSVGPDDYAAMPVDEAYYLMQNPDVAASGITAVWHFGNRGYWEMRNPHPDFDLWWYAQNYLLGTPDAGVDALKHYNDVGVKLGHLTRPPVPVKFNTEHSRSLKNSPRRVCLFAAYDIDGIVDESVLDYLRDLSKYADIYYLADNLMDAEELAKLEGLVKGAWAQRHGMYDFGSYSILARDLVGWDVIEGYDELIFANDSCYLVHPFKDTFETMAKRGCAWWGLQATKGLISTAHQNKIPTDAPLSIEDIKTTHLSEFENDPIYDFHLGSYFIVFRSDIIKDAGFRRVLNSVAEEPNKLRIIRKYEIGITRYLIGRGFEFETLVGIVPKRHQIFTERAFDLLDNGFPLLKRYLLAENHYKMKGLAQWKYRVQQANPDANLGAMEKNLLRVSNARKLFDNFRYTQDPALLRTPRSHDVMRAQDKTVPKYDHWWAFPVCVYSHQFSDNTRAVFEQVKNDPSIKKIVLTRGNHIETDGVNVVSAPIHSYEGQSYLLRARQVFLRHGVRANLGYPLSSDLHNFHNLWHGIPLKLIGYTSLDNLAMKTDTASENKRLRSVISASDVDRLAMTAAYWPMTFHDIWVTGLPRHDMIMAPEDALPQDFLDKAAQLKDRLRGRKFFLFAPTFRADQEGGYYRFNEDEVQQISSWLAHNNIAMGIREHMADTARLYSTQLRGDEFFDASERHYPDIELLYRHADMLLTDYSSCFIDFMLTGRPMASFAFDQHSYANAQRGLFYDQEMVFPGPVCKDFNSLMLGLEKMLEVPSDADRQAYEWKVNFFHKYRDDQNSMRVVERVKETYTGSKMLWRAPKAKGKKAQRSITFVCSENNKRSNRYRVFNLVEHLQDKGWQCRVVMENKVTAGHIQKIDALVLCRVPMSETLRDHVETFRTHGGKVVFDLDGPLHDIELFSHSEAFRMNLGYASDFTIRAMRIREMIESTDFVTAATPSLVKNVQQMGRPAALVPNSISRALHTKYQSFQATRANDGKVKICYLSGTATHAEDFAQCEKAVLAMLKKYPEAELHIVGALDAEGQAGPKARGNIKRHAFMPYDTMQDFLSGMDINLAPLAPTDFNDYKCESKIFEAALHRVPTVASPTHSYAKTIISGKTGLLAKSTLDWKKALAQLIENPALRHSMGQAAYQRIVPEFSAAKSADALLGVLNVLLSEEHSLPKMANR